MLVTYKIVGNMRKIVSIRRPKDNYTRLMISPCEGGCYLYFYETHMDGPCSSDVFCFDMDEALGFAKEEYGVNENEWRDIPDAKENCHDDWIADVARRFLKRNGS